MTMLALHSMRRQYVLPIFFDKNRFSSYVGITIVFSYLKDSTFIWPSNFLPESNMSGQGDCRRAFTTDLSNHDFLAMIL